MMPSIQNTYLIEACRKGDPKAQLQVYKLFFNQMFSLSLKVVNDADAAGEIVREAFFTAFDRKDPYKEQSDFITRLKKMVADRSAEKWKMNNVAFPGLVMDRPIVK